MVQENFKSETKNGLVITATKPNAMQFTNSTLNSTSQWYCRVCDWKELGFPMYLPVLGSAAFERVHNFHCQPDTEPDEAFGPTCTSNLELNLGSVLWSSGSDRSSGPNYGSTTTIAKNTLESLCVAPPIDHLFSEENQSVYPLIETNCFTVSVHCQRTPKQNGDRLRTVNDGNENDSNPTCSGRIVLVWWIP